MKLPYGGLGNLKNVLPKANYEESETKSSLKTEQSEE